MCLLSLRYFRPFYSPGLSDIKICNHAIIHNEFAIAMHLFSPLCPPKCKMLDQACKASSCTSAHEIHVVIENIEDIYQRPASTAGPSNTNAGIANSNKLRLFELVEPLLFWTVRLPMSHQFLMGW